MKLPVTDEDVRDNLAFFDYVFKPWHRYCITATKHSTMIRSICLLLIPFVVFIYTTNGQNRFKSRKQKPKLEIGVDLRQQGFMYFPFFPTTRLTIGLNNGKNSMNVIFYSSAVSLDYLGIGIKYSRYKPLSKKFLLGIDGEVSIMKGMFPYNELNLTSAAPYFINKNCAMASVSLNLGYIINPKNQISFYSGIGGIYTFNKIDIPDHIKNMPKEYDDQMLGMQYQVGFTYKRLIKL
jgi:hypothetical protein